MFTRQPETRCSRRISETSAFPGKKQEVGDKGSFPSSVDSETLSSCSKKQWVEPTATAGTHAKGLGDQQIPELSRSGSEWGWGQA